MSIFDGIPLATFGQDDPEDFPLMDVNNNYLPQPFTNEEDSNGSIFDPDNNLLPPTSEIEDMPIEMALPGHQSQPTTTTTSTSTVHFQEPMFSTIDPATTFRMTVPPAIKEEPFTIPNIMDEIGETTKADTEKSEIKTQPMRQPLAPIPINCPIPHTPQKPVDECPLDPLTPTANLKILMSAASPEIRNRDNMRRLLNEGIAFQQENRRKNADDITQDESSRKDKSLGLLCQRFLDLFPDYPDSHEIPEISLDAVSKDLGVERRRIYDIVNVLESVEMVNRVGKNKYLWYGKTRLNDTLRALKIRSVSEDYPAQVSREKELDRMRDLQKLASIGQAPTGAGAMAHAVFKDPEPVTGKELHNARAGMRKDKSLSLISQKFIMIFLAAGKEVITLEMAAKILSDNPEMDKQDGGKFKTKIRRLYDIANILISLGLIEKVYSTHSRGRKPGFTYIGPCLSESCRQQGCLCGLTVPTGPKVEKRGRGRPATKSQPKKKTFARHSSFDLICRAASEERQRLYSSVPSSPGKTVASKGQENKPQQPNGMASTEPVKRVLKLVRKQPYLNLDQLNKTELVITEITRQSSSADVSLTSSVKRDGQALLSDAKRTRVKEDEEVCQLTDSIPFRVKTTPVHRLSPRVLHFDNTARSNPTPGEGEATGANIVSRTIRILPSGHQNSSLTGGITLVVRKQPSHVGKNENQYTTPVRVLSEKAISPSTRTTLFQAMQARLKSPDTKPDIGTSSNRISFVRSNSA